MMDMHLMLPLLPILFSLLLPLPAAGQLVFLQPGFEAETVASGLPRLVQSVASGGDGFLYAIVDDGTGDVSPDDNSLLRIDPSTGGFSSQGKIALTNPSTSNLYRLARGPGGTLTSKLYVVDWISGAPARIDRFETDLSDHETVFASQNGDPVDTPTSSIAFSTGPPYLEAGYFAAQGSGVQGVWRFGTLPGELPSLWANPSNSADVRGIAFGLGSAWGTSLYVAQSSVQNGFDDAPGEIRRLDANATGDFGAQSVVVGEATGLLEFGIDMAFDPGGLFGGDLLYLQADGQLLRVTAAGAVTLFATGVGTLLFDDAGDLLLLVRGASDSELLRVLGAAPVPTLAPLGLGVLAALLLATVFRFTALRV